MKNFCSYKRLLLKKMKKFGYSKVSYQQNNLLNPNPINKAQDKDWKYKSIKEKYKYGF